MDHAPVPATSPVIGPKRPSWNPDSLPSLKKVVVLVIIFAGLVTIAGYMYAYIHQGNSYSVESKDLVSVDRTDSRPSFVYQYQPGSKGNYHAYMVLVGGAELPALSVVPTSPTESYYILLENASTSVSNVYKSTKGAITKVTNSSSLKRDLSVDPSSGKIAFNTPNGLTIFDSKSNTETITNFKGQHAVLLPGGDDLFLVGSTSLALASLGNNSSKRLLAIDSPTLVAVSKDGSMIAAYNAITKSIDRYSYSPAKGISFKASSKPFPQEVHAMSYVGSDLEIVYSNDMAAYAIENLSTGAVITRPFLGPTILPDHIFRDHE